MTALRKKYKDIVELRIELINQINELPNQKEDMKSTENKNKRK